MQEFIAVTFWVCRRVTFFVQTDVFCDILILEKGEGGWEGCRMRQTIGEINLAPLCVKRGKNSQLYMPEGERGILW